MSVKRIDAVNTSTHIKLRSLLSIAIYDRVNTQSSILAMLESDNTAVFIAGGVTKGGCDIAKATGIFGFLFTNSTWKVTSDLGLLTLCDSV